MFGVASTKAVMLTSKKLGTTSITYSVKLMSNMQLGTLSLCPSRPVQKLSEGSTPQFQKPLLVKSFALRTFSRLLGKSVLGNVRFVTNGEAKREPFSQMRKKSFVHTHTHLAHFD